AGLRDAGRDPAAQGRRARRAVRAGRAGDRGAGGGRQRARADGRAEPARGVPGGQRHIHQRGDGEADSRACRRGGGGHPAGRWARRRGKERGGDEFGEFLADVAVTVGKAVEAWRARVGEAVLRWEGEGYRTHRLEALLQRDAPGAVDQAITAFAEDV